MEEIQRGQAADDRGHNRREQDGERVHIALVENSEDHIHDKDGSEQQQGQRLEQLPKYKRFALEDSLHGWITRMDLIEGLLNVLRGIANGDVRQQVEVERDAGELIQMVHSLRSNDFPGRCYNTHRDEIRHVTCGRSDGSSAPAARAEVTPCVAADVEIVQVVRVRALLVFNFENDLILVVWLLDEIDVVLRVGVAQKTLDCRSRNAIGCGTIAVNVDLEIGRVVVVIGADAGEAFELLKFFHQLVGYGINILRDDAANRVGILSLGLTGGTDADLQYRLRR